MTTKSCTRFLHRGKPKLVRNGLKMAVTGRQPKLIVDASMFTHIDIFFTLKEKGRPDSLVRGVVRGVGSPLSEGQCFQLNRSHT